MKKNNKGFTLVELLAVIVILGLLMAIAIPSVTKYITQSRKKTLISSVDSYVTAVTTAVNDQTFGALSDESTMYYIPVSNIGSDSCVSLEKGGSDPFGNWKEAYVVVNYDADKYSYDYYFTFYDDAGYGMALTKIDNITGDVITNPSPVTEEDITTQTNDRALNIKILVSGTCNVENALDGGFAFATVIKQDNTIITATPTLTAPSINNGENGLYASSSTNSGNPTYYFRGNVTNNYVKFAGLTWRIVRINEDGTVRIVLNDRIGNTTYVSDNSYLGLDRIYYSTGKLKVDVDTWYASKIANAGYDEYVADGKFCEEAKVVYSNYTAANATVQSHSTYVPTFRCATDGNGKGIVESKAGLLTYDEVIYAGAHSSTSTQFYLYDGRNNWTMTPGGLLAEQYAAIWYVAGDYVNVSLPNSGQSIRPVINLKARVIVEGSGTSADPYVVKTN